MKRFIIVILSLCNFSLAYSQSYQGPMELPYEVKECFNYTHWGPDKEVYGNYNYYVKDGKRVKHGAASFKFEIGIYYHLITGQYSNGKMTGVWKEEKLDNASIDRRNIITYTLSDGEREGKFSAYNQSYSFYYPEKLKGTRVGDGYWLICSLTGFIQNNKPIDKLKFYYDWNKNKTRTLIFDNNGCLNGNFIVEEERYKEERTYNHGLLVYCSLLDKSTGDLYVTDNLTNLKIYTADNPLSETVIDGYYLIEDNDSLYYAKQVDTSHSRLDYFPFGYDFDSEAFYEVERILKVYHGLDITYPTILLYAVDPNEQETIRKEEEEAKRIAEEKKRAEEAKRFAEEIKRAEKAKKIAEEKKRGNLINDIHTKVAILNSQEIAQKLISIELFTITNKDQAKLRKSCIQYIYNSIYDELNRTAKLDALLLCTSEEAFNITCEQNKEYTDVFSDALFKKLYIFATYRNLLTTFSTEELEYLNSKLEKLNLERREQAKYLDSIISLYENMNVSPLSTDERKILNKHIREDNATEIQKFWMSRNQTEL